MENIVKFEYFSRHPVRTSIGDDPHEKIQVFVSIWRKWKIRRDLARELEPQPDSVLADAGWTRQALRDELAKPVWR